MNSWIVTPAFCKLGMLSEFLSYLNNKVDTTGFHHAILDNHYPGDGDADRQERFQYISKFHHKIYIDSLYDRGLHRSVNHAIRILDIQPNDIYIGCDPDDRPSPKAFQAIRDVMLADPTFAVVALNFWVLPWKMNEQGLVMKEEVIAGHRVWIHPGVEMWNVAGFNMRLVSEMGGFKQPNAYYGGIEIALCHEWAKRGMKLGYLVDHTAEAAPVDRENPMLYDKSYGEWKVAHATKGYTKSYAEWLKEKT